MLSEKREVTGRRRGEGRRRTEELVRVTRVMADVFNFAGQSEKSVWFRIKFGTKVWVIKNAHTLSPGFSSRAIAH